MNSTRELESIIISMDEIIGKLNSFFTDSVILRMNYDIEALGGEVETFLGLSSGEVCGQPFSTRCADQRAISVIESEIKQGYFDGIATSFLNKQNEPVRVRISGFYLGLISDINGYIILKVKLLEDNAFLKNELITKKQELDSFIYRSAHDLRGPIATIKGLVNLLKIRQGEHEVDELTSLIEVHANKLDERLFRLLYVADNHNEPEDCVGVLHFETLNKALQQTLTDNFQINNSLLRFTAPEQSVPCLNELGLTRLLSNLLLYIVGLPLAMIPAEDKIFIAIDFEILANTLKVQIRAKGFLAGENVREVICQPISLYNDILSYPYLFNYYAAQREARQVNGVLSVVFVQTDEQLLLLTIPLNFSLRLAEGATTGARALHAPAENMIHNNLPANK